MCLAQVFRDSSLLPIVTARQPRGFEEETSPLILSTCRSDLPERKDTIPGSEFAPMSGR